MGAAVPCERSHLGIRRSSPWGHEACEGVPKWVWGAHAGGGTGAFGGAPYGATTRVRGVLNWVCVTHAGGPVGASGGAPYGATKRVRGVPNWVCVTHAGGPIGAFGGAPCGATIRVRSVPKWGGGATRTLAWGLRWNSRWGHESRDERAKQR